MLGTDYLFVEGDESEHLGSGDNDDEPRDQEPLREQVNFIHYNIT